MLTANISKDPAKDICVYISISIKDRYRELQVICVFALSQALGSVDCRK